MEPLGPIGKFDMLEKHVSPDGALTLLVVRYPDGDICIGFEGTPWHTHGESEAAVRGTSVPLAVRQFVDEILSDQTILAVERVGDRISWVYPEDDAEGRLDGHRRYAPADSSITFRRWTSAEELPKPERTIT